MLERVFDFVRIKKNLILQKGARWYADVSPTVRQRLPIPMARALTATTTLTADDNGSTLFLNSATEFATTLPAPALGMRFDFVVQAAPSGASYTILSGSSANIIKGSVYSADLNAASDGDIETAGGDTITIVDSKAVAGDRVSLISDGTSWHMAAFTSVFDAVTITTAS